MPKWVDFPGSNIHLAAPEGHEADIEPLRAHSDGIVTTICAKLSLDDIIRVINTGEIWFSIMRGSGPFYPVRILIERPPEIDE